jgi:asparaginyl-tRNA synthetase
MRGEDADARHLNQFFHCEYEAQETLEEVMAVAEKYVHALAQIVNAMPGAIERLSNNPEKTRQQIDSVLNESFFHRISFDKAVNVLQNTGENGYVEESSHGFDLTSKGERKLLELLKADRPIWVTHYPRDRVPFYQKPMTENPDRVLNADLLCPAIVESGFSGEFLGLGQRQDMVEEMYESMRRQAVDPAPYEWYVDLRRNPAYKTTSGFGLGIERFIAWLFGFDSIHKAILYPRMKGVLMNP